MLGPLTLERLTRMVGHPIRIAVVMADERPEGSTMVAGRQVLALYGDLMVARLRILTEIPEHQLGGRLRVRVQVRVMLTTLGRQMTM